MCVIFGTEKGKCLHWIMWENLEIQILYDIDDYGTADVAKYSLNAGH
jgi:hypothetical protein